MIRDDLLKKIKGYLAWIFKDSRRSSRYSCVTMDSIFHLERRRPFSFFLSLLLPFSLRFEARIACSGLFISYARRYSPEAPSWSAGEVWSGSRWAYRKVDCWWRRASGWARISRWTTSRRRIPLGWIACRSDRETLPVGRLCRNNATPGISSLRRQRSRGRTGRRSRNSCRAPSPAPDNPCLVDLQSQWVP